LLREFPWNLDENTGAASVSGGGGAGPTGKQIAEAPETGEAHFHAHTSVTEYSADANRSLARYKRDWMRNWCGVSPKCPAQGEHQWSACTMGGRKETVIFVPGNHREFEMTAEFA
jgi:hypothetical protein